MQLKKILILTGFLVIAAVILAACGQTAIPPTTAPTEAPTEAPPAMPDVPFLGAWQGSGHDKVSDEPFRHWDDATANPDGVPTSCAKCHTTAGYVDFLQDGKVDNTVPAKDSQGIVCMACHSPEAMALTSVTFPSGKVVETSEEGEARCMTCHQGRESKASVDKQIADFNATDPDAVPAPIKDANGKDKKFGFLNIHYFAAGATLYGSQAEGGYQYDGKVYDPKFRHVAEMDTCIACHDQHSTTVRIEKCAGCHEGVKTVDDLKNVRMNGSLVDYDGDGDITEGIAGELSGIQDVLYAQIQTYAKDKAGTPIAYDAATYPYFFAAGADGTPAKDDKGNPVGYSTWTPRLLKAAFNYQVSVKDPGAFAHNAKYIIELMYDSIQDLGGDVSKLARDDAGHFAGNTEPFRHWDAEGEVPAGCAKCHSAGGLPQFIENGGTTFLSGSSLGITGVVAQPIANGFMCSTCHDEANWPNRYAVTTVPFPSGAKLTFSTEKDADGNLVPVDANLCIECHQGRESTVSVNKYLADKPADTADPKISFRNVHYFAAGATLFGTDAKGAYEYDGQTYLGYNATHPLNKCTDCHEVHALTVKTDACKTCHTNVSGVADLENIRMPTDAVDYNGNGDTTEGIYKEIDSFRTALYAAIQDYAENKAGTPVVYDADSYPYFFVDADKDGKPDTNDKGLVGYNAWTPRLLKAAYNYQYSIKDPGAFAHNPKYVLQFLYDSIKDLGGDVSTFTRPEAPAQ